MSKAINPARGLKGLRLTAPKASRTGLSSDENTDRQTSSPPAADVSDEECDLTHDEDQVVMDAMRWACRLCIGPEDKHRRRFVKAMRVYYATLPDEELDRESLTPSLSRTDIECVGAFRQLAAAGLRDLYAQRGCVPDLPLLDQVDILAGLLLTLSEQLTGPVVDNRAPDLANEIVSNYAGSTHVGDSSAAQADLDEADEGLSGDNAQHAAMACDSSAELKQLSADLPSDYVDWDVEIAPRPVRTNANLDGDNARLAREHDVWRFLSGADLSDTWATCFPSARPIVEANAHYDTGQQPLAILPAAALTLGEQERLRHTLVIGPTGSGKSTRFMHAVLRSDIADPRKTVILLDSKGGELLPLAETLSAEYREGQPVRVVDFGNPDNTIGWNPLETLKSFAEVRGFAHRLCRATESRSGAPDSEFWVTAATKLLAAILWALRYDDDEPYTLARAQQIIEWSIKDIRMWCEAHADVPGLQSYCEFLNSGSHNAHTILADLQNRLSLWHDENVCKVTSRDELMLSEVLSTPSVVVLRVNEADVSALKPLTNSFFSEVVSTLFRLVEQSPGGRLAVPVSLIIEEFASAVGKIPDFNRFINVVRSRGLSVTASVQSLSQVEFEYGKESEPILAGFCSKVFFAGVSPNDAAYASSLFGAMTVEHREETYARDAVKTFDSSAYMGESVKIVPRAILTPHEIRRPVRHPELGEAVTFDLPGVPPFQAFLTPSYDLREFGALLDRVRTASKLGAPRGKDTYPLEDGRGPLPFKPATSSQSSQHLPPGITDTRGMTEDKVRDLLETTKKQLDLKGANESAQKWWLAFESENAHRLALVLRLAEELKNRKASIQELFLAYVYSNTDNIQANLCYLDYTRLKKEEERKKKNAQRNAARSTKDDHRIENGD